MMKRFAVALSGLLLWAGSAVAQTTTLNPSDKDPFVALSGGNLTASFSASWRLVRATVAKYHGKFCYQITVNATPVNFSFGFASDAWPLNTSSGDGRIGGYLLPTTQGGAFPPNIYINGTSYASNGIISWWNGHAEATPDVFTGVGLALGKTAEACVDMDQGTINPPLVWFTPDVSSTSGAAGGPVWNGSVTANPATGTGGRQTFLPKYGFFPAINGSSGDQITAKFTGFTPPSGFSTWNTSGGAASTPGPLSPLVINVANAPIWQAGHIYALKDRVVAGPAWNGSTYTDGQDLCLFAVKVAGTSGSSFSSFNTACSSGTPAGSGGGLDGSIPSPWTAATAVTDGGVTWALLSKVDYHDLTSAFADDATEWAPNTGYGYNTVINKAKFSYVQRNSTPCTSGASWGGVAGTDGTCVWETYNPHHPTQVNYTSQTHRWPHFVTNVSAPNSNYVHRGFDYATNLKIWYGGAQRPEYVAGANGESQTILNRNHTLGFAQEEYAYCNKYGYLTAYDWIKFADCFWGAKPATITPADGDGFRDNPGPLRYDPLRGVAFYSNSTEGPYGGLGPPPPASTALYQGDFAIVTTGLQFYSQTGMAAAGGFVSEWHFNIMDAGGPMVYGGCCEPMIGNIMVSRSTSDGAMGMFEKYHNPFNQNTIIGSNATHSTGFAPGISGWNQDVPSETIKNNLIFGFTYPFSHNWDFVGIYNGSYVVWPSDAGMGGQAGDAQSPTPDADFNNPINPYGYSGNWRTQVLNGYNSTCGAGNTSPCTGLSPSDVFVNPTIGASLDLRLKSGSVVLGAGVASDPRDGLPYDIFGTVRPQGIRYDPGAFQLATGGSTPSVSLIASPSTITLGNASILTWTSANVSACTGTNFSTGGTTSGSLSVSPASTITYSISCDSGAATASRTVTVNSLVPTATLSPAQTTITLGQTATLGWTCTNSTSSVGSGFSTGTAPGLLSGTAGVTPSSTTTYGLTCTGSGGTATANSTVTVTTPGNTAISTIRLCSTSGSDLAADTPSPPMFGLEFRKGDIPAGQYPQLQAQDGTPWPATFINKRSWSDGSMKIVGVLPGPFPKVITPACVTANVLNGGAAPAASGLTPTQLYSELMQVNANGFAGALGTGLGFTGNWSAKLANDANNVEVVNYGDGGGGRVYRILTHVQQSGTPHGQMEVYWYVQQLRDAAGGVAGYRVLPRLTQPWYNVDSPAKDWRGLQTFNIQYGSGPTTITPPYPAADEPLSINAGGWHGTDSFIWDVTVSDAYHDCGSGSQQTCKFAGYFTANPGGTLPTPIQTNTLYCGDTTPASFGQVTFRFGTCNGGVNLGFSNPDGGVGSFTFHPVSLLPHFGSLWGARNDGRYTYIQGSGSAAVDAPILVKGNPVYDQSTKLWPPFDLTVTADDNQSTWFSGGPVQFDTMTIGPIIQNLGQGGERDEIGLRTAWCSRAFYNRSLISDKWVRILGLVSKQLPMHVRDSATRGFIHLGDPAKSYTGMGASLATTFRWDLITGSAGFTVPLHGAASMFGGSTDTSHMPDFSGCAYLMTGEPQYLDTHMDEANQAIFHKEVGFDSTGFLAHRNPVVNGTTYYGSVMNSTVSGIRVMAWGLRPIVDLDAWMPDVDPTGTQTHQYFHDLEQTSTAMPAITTALDNSWAQTNCFWHPPTGAPRVPWMINYMNTVMMNAYNANEDSNALWFLNCSATWLKHLFNTYTSSVAGFSEIASEERAYDTGSTASAGALEFYSVDLTWAAGVATLTLQDPTKSRSLYTGMRANIKNAGAYNNDQLTPVTLTVTSPTTATFPLASDPGGPGGGLLWPIGTLIDSDEKYSMHPVSEIGLYGTVWQAGTPGSVAHLYQPGHGVSWAPANGDKIIFERNTPSALGKVPGGLQMGTPYYAVNTHAGNNCVMSWSGGTLIVTTCAPHGMTVGQSRVIAILGADATGISTGWGSPNPILNNCQATDTTNFTCPVASNPGIGTSYGTFNTSDLAATPGGSPLAMTTSDNTLDQSTGAGYLAAAPPAEFSGDYFFYAGYLAVARGAIHGLIASGITGLENIKAENDFRFNANLAYWGQTYNDFYKTSPKYAMTSAFGTGAPPPAPTPFVTLTATPNTISLGNSSTLSWSGTAVANCTSPQFTTVGSISGSVLVSPTVTMAYGITCDGGAATANATITVNPVVPPPGTAGHGRGHHFGRGLK